MLVLGRDICTVLSLLVVVDGPRDKRCRREDAPTGFGVALASLGRGRGLGICGRAIELAWKLDRSEFGGEGGVCVSDTVEEADFVCGVAMVGEEVEVVGEDSDSDVWGRGNSN